MSVNNLFKFYVSKFPYIRVVNYKNPSEFEYVKSSIQYNEINTNTIISELMNDDSELIDKSKLINKCLIETHPNVVKYNKLGALYYAVLDNNINMVINILFNKWLIVDFIHDPISQFYNIIKNAPQWLITNIKSNIIQLYFDSYEKYKHMFIYTRLPVETLKQIYIHFEGIDSLRKKLNAGNSVAMAINSMLKPNKKYNEKTIIEYYINEYNPHGYEFTEKDKLIRRTRFLYKYEVINVLYNFAEIYPYIPNIKDKSDDITKLLKEYSDVYNYKYIFEKSEREYNWYLNALYNDLTILYDTINDINSDILAKNKFNYLDKLSSDSDVETIFEIQSLIKNIYKFKTIINDENKKLSREKKFHDYDSANKKFMENQNVKSWHLTKSYMHDKYIKNINTYNRILHNNEKTLIEKSKALELFKPGVIDTIYKKINSFIKR